MTVIKLENGCISSKGRKAGGLQRNVVEKQWSWALLRWQSARIVNLEGTSCFYLDIDDKERHKKVLQYFLDHDMIRRTKTGKLYNISFKLDSQTRAGEYGADFKGELKLEDFLDLNTGKWLV